MGSQRVSALYSIFISQSRPGLSKNRKKLSKRGGRQWSGGKSWENLEGDP